MRWHMPVDGQLVPLWKSLKYLPEAVRERRGREVRPVVDSTPHPQKLGTLQAEIWQAAAFAESMLLPGEGTELAPLSGSRIQGGKEREISGE